MDDMLDPKTGLSRSVTDDAHFQEAVDEAISKGYRPGTAAFRSAVIQYVWQFPYVPPPLPEGRPVQPHQPGQYFMPKEMRPRHGVLIKIDDDEPSISNEQLDAIKEGLKGL